MFSANFRKPASVEQKAEQKAEELLGANRDKLDLLAEALQAEETLDGARVDEIIGRDVGREP
jgi:cell division protease FtsH